MKLSYQPSKKAFTIENIHYIAVQRPKEFKVSFADGRKHHAFVYTVSGCICYSFLEPERKDILTEAGNLVFIPAGTRHYSTYMDENNTLNIIKFDLSSGQLPNHLSEPCIINSDQLENLFYSICADIQSGAENSTMYLLYRMYELFWNIYKNNQKIPAKFKKLQMALKELRLYYAANQKIKYYADLCGMSEPGFRRLFKEYTNMSPIDYRNQIRIQEAQKLLSSGEFSVEEVSLQVGFSNLSFFCRSYKQQFGHSPRKDS